LFNGRHRTAPDQPEPFDSGQSFQPDLDKIPPFLADLPSLSPLQADALEVPFDYSELSAAVDAAAASKAPGLDGLSYEFYKTVFPVIGPQLVVVFNNMLEAAALPPSLRRGVVRLLPKVRGVPTAAQFRPITLLCTDYKNVCESFAGCPA
jgi:hypothetical protein